MVVDKRQKIAEFLKKVTASCRKDVQDVSIDDLSPKAKDVKRIIDSGAFGCNTKAVASLCSVLLGEKIQLKGEKNIDNNLKVFSVVAYEDDDVYIICDVAYGDYYYLDTDGDSNDIPIFERLATDGEIENLVRVLTKEQISRFEFLFV